jgi:DNA repair exonuclease SbcCD nuclease subunit
VRNSVTFIHAADLHLDTPFQGVSATDDKVGQALAEATYDAWRAIVDLAIEREVDFVVVAGDVYNAGNPTLRGQFFMREQAQRLGAAGIGLYLVTGNHDPLDGTTAGLTLGENVHLFPGGRAERVQAVSEDGFVCGIYGRSYERRDEPDDFTPGYRREKGDTVAIGVLHANVGVNSEYAAYAPCTLEGLRAASMDYWALGHIHRHEVLSTAPYAVQAGSPQGLNPKDTGTHGCCVVTIEGGGRVTAFDQVDLAPISWAQRDVDVAGIETIEELEELLGRVTDEIRAETKRPTVARLALTGRSGIHRALTRPDYLTHLTEKLREDEAPRSSWVWIDRIDDKTKATIDLDALRKSPDVIGDVVRIGDELLGDLKTAEALIEKSSAAVRKGMPDFVPAESVEALIERARDRVLDLLVDEEVAE